MTNLSAMIRFLLALSILAFLFSAKAAFDFTLPQWTLIKWSLVVYMSLAQITLFLPQNKKLAWLPACFYVIDVLLATLLIQWTGRGESLFSALFFLPILESTLSYGLSGGIGAALACSGFFLGSMYAGDSTNIHWSTGINHVLAFVTIGLMSGLLRSRLQTARQRIDHLENINDAIINNIASGIVVFDAQKKVLSMNPAGEAILELKADNWNLIHERLASPLPINMTASDERPVIHYNHPTKGKRDLGFSLTHLPDPTDPEKRALLFSFQDLTRIRQIQEQLFNSKKLAAIGSLAASIAHEIRNPLASISGCVEMLKNHVGQGEEPEKLLKIVLKETDRLNKLISEFLNYVGKQELIKTTVDLNVIVRETIEEIRIRKDYPSGATLSFDSAQELNTSVDVNKFKQALLNILLNALQSLEGPGSIAITGSSEKDGVHLTVKDSGVGISSENLEKIFDPFFTTKKAGTGLGLAMTQKIIEGHGGKIRVESTPGQGTTFSVQLPKESS